MATPTFVAVGTVGQNGGSGAPTAPGVPVGTTTDDILLAVGAGADNVAMSWAGYTAASATNNTANLRLTVALKRAGGAESAPAVTHASGNSASSVLVCIRGVPNTIALAQVIAVLGTASVNSAATSATVGGLTPAGTTDLVIAVIAAGGGSTANQSTFGTLSGTDPTFTSRVGNQNGLGTLEADLNVQTGPTVSAAATGNRTATLAVSNLSIGLMLTINDVGAVAAVAPVLGPAFQAIPFSPVISA
jgi:hypothetical protein